MKKTSLFKICAIFFCSLLLLSCNPSKPESSAEDAQKKNDENFATRDGEKDAAFIVKTIEGNFTEIKLAQLAMTKTIEIKGVAEMLEKEHSKILNELKDLAFKKGVAIPVEENPDSKADIIALEKKDPVEFDKEWLAVLIANHEKTIKRFESTSDDTQDAELKSWVDNTLPVLHKHLDRLTELKKR